MTEKKRQPPMCRNCFRDEAQHTPDWYCRKFEPRKGRARVPRTMATMDDIRALMAFAFRQAADWIEKGGDPKSAAAGVLSVAKHALEQGRPEPALPQRKGNGTHAPTGPVGPSPEAPVRPLRETLRDVEKVKRSAADGLGTCERKILTVLAARGSRKTSAMQAALLSGYRLSGSFNDALRFLRAAGYLVGASNADLVLSDDGRKKAGDVPVLPSGPTALAFWQQELGDCAGKILGVLVREYPDEVEVEAIAERTDYKVSGSFNDALRAMRKLGLIERSHGKAKATSEMIEVLQ